MSVLDVMAGSNDALPCVPQVVRVNPVTWAAICLTHRTATVGVTQRGAEIKLAAKCRPFIDPEGYERDWQDMIW